ncbi:acetoin dehydrogenase dihydrolipoyllysine-residue acetyltransferase subunit [Falsochrobactrum sp. TDYN1]|uniref:Acetoin dehydrogenase dihydrolipoyllysine-residue acetyltransferase subunit n=1 Tax=Falsochrobactrum tianjinense TaxID=2706015 RepID=A0A949PJR4_9HYPH|nr:acetoin dehydrogenase dihydrolipoyllysine-residue acetyltransferase subunit [Falsochrobactrum sp. TDYN1]MBV2142132.1 acetoin dehydrogenase dihydrolipoyllysine-residue acetyltransferase subunit [Falsochrobactrum sp. TDYN1]
MANHPISIESAGGEYMESVVVLGWSVQPGAAVKAGQLIVTVETAKAATEIEADRDGWLAEIFFDEGQEAPLGAVLGTISDTEPSQVEEPEKSASLAEGRAQPVKIPDQPVPVKSQQKGGRVIASPLARRVARDAGLDLTGIAGTGPKGRIKQRDVVAVLNASPKAVAPPQPVHSISSAGTQQRPVDPVVLLHGFGADRSSWRQVTSLLPSEYDIVALDLPGHGLEAERSVTSFEDIVFDVSDRLEAMGIDRAHIVGHSLGGAVALGLTSFGKVSVRSATLLAPGGLGPEINIDFINGLARSTTEQALERWLTVMVSDPASLPQGYARAALRQMQNAGVQEGLSSLALRLFPDGTQGFDILKALQNLQVPARTIWGRADHVIPVSHSNRVPGHVATHLLDGIGHVPQLEASELTARLITQTIKSAN